MTDGGDVSVCDEIDNGDLPAGEKSVLGCDVLSVATSDSVTCSLNVYASRSSLVNFWYALYFCLNSDEIDEAFPFFFLVRQSTRLRSALNFSLGPCSASILSICDLISL